MIKTKGKRKTKEEVIAANRAAYLRCINAPESEHDEAIAQQVAAKLDLRVDQVIPRENLLTFAAWNGCGRTVTRKQRAVYSGTSYAPMKPSVKALQSNPDAKGGLRKVSYALFHITQTEELV